MESPERIKVSEIKHCVSMTFENFEDLVQMVSALDLIIMEHWRSKDK